MKNMKKQLFTAVAMLLVATVALGTATYAWFVNNATVEVDNMNFTAESSMALEIGVNKSGNDPTTTAGTITYGNLVSLADIKGIKDYSTSFAAVSLKPASADDAALKAGNFFYDKTWGVTNGAVQTYSELADTDIGYGVVKMVPLWFRASQDMKIHLASGSAVTATVGALDKKPGVNSDQIDKALRISFVYSDAAGTKQVKTYAFEGDTSKNVTGAKYNYDTTAGEAKKGVASIDADGKATFAAQTYEQKIGGGFPVVNNTTNIWDSGFTKDANTDIREVKAGEESLVMVYVWLEGCDAECVTAVSGGKVDVKLNFIGEPITLP